MPAEVAGFVGRARLIKDVRKVLSTSRAVTLIGVGGVGKTRLALRLAHEVRPAFADGVWFVELMDLPDTAGSSMVEQAVATAFGMTDFSADRPREALVDHLRGKHCLLVLDNCEHLVEEAGALVAHLLVASRGLHVLATSREVLGCIGEYVVYVPPLSTPHVGIAVPPLSALDEDPQVAPAGEALELLRQRAAAVGAPVRAVDLDVAAELCRQLDGLPLAIELAAGRLNTLTIREVLERLDDRFKLLITGARHAPVTHRTLRRVLDWSYYLCDEHERLLWERISVFVGGFDLAAAEDICSAEGIVSDEVLDILTGLVRQSVIVVDHRGTRARYRLLETLRHYGLQALAKRDQETTFRRRHRDYYHGLAAQAASDWFSPREAQWLEWAGTDLPNLRAAMEYSLTDGDVANTLETAINLTRLRIFFFIGWPGEGRAWLERLLALELTSPQRMIALETAGWISLCQGDTRAASGFLADCRASVANQTDVPAALDFLEGAYALVVESDPRSIPMLGQVLAKLQRVGAPVADTALIQLYWSLAASFLGDRATALRASQQCLDSAERQAAAWAISWAQWAVGLAQMRHGDHRRALTVTRESLRRQQEMGDRSGTIWGTHAVAWALAAGLRARSVDEPDTRIAENIARILGGAHRLRRQNGVHLAGLGPFNTATAEAEHTAREALSEQAYLRAFEQGSFPDADDTQAYRQILALALGQQHPTAPQRALSDSALTRSADEPRAEQLTTREREIAALVAQGQSNPQIARKLVISDRTVQTHVGNILNKRGLRNRHEITVWYMQQHPQPSPISGPN